MNNDEMIKEQIEKMAQILFNVVGDAITFEQTSLIGGSVKTDCFKLAETLYTAGYQKVADDEIVIKKSEQNQWLKDCIESNKKTEEIAQKQTARELLKEIKQKYGRSCSEYYPEYIEFTGWELNKIAKKYGVELED